MSANSSTHLISKFDPSICPEYTAPKTGIFALMPPSWIPYAELMRLDRPAGYYAFYWHYAIGLEFAACISSSTPVLSTLIMLAAYLALWVVVLRGAACTLNDNLDQEFDRKVTRTRNRPIARGAVSTTQAHIFTIVQIVVGAVLLLPLPIECSYYAAPMTAILLVYPLGKRLMDFPQVILGFGLAMPVFLCCAALGVDVLPLSLSYIHHGENDKNASSLISALCLYFSGILWTVIFDTVYAHQDIKDDIKAGVRSLAVLLGKHTKPGLSVLAIAQVTLLVVAGVVCKFSIIYFAVSCGGTAVALAAMFKFVDLDKPASCAWWFGPGSHLVGASIVVGLLGEYCFKLLSDA